MLSVTAYRVRSKQSEPWTCYNISSDFFAYKDGLRLFLQFLFEKLFQILKSNLFNKVLIFNVLSMSVFPVCMCVYHAHAWYPQRSKEVVSSPRTGVIDGCGALCGCWEPKLGPLGKQPVLLTPERSLQTEKGSQCRPW